MDPKAAIQRLSSAPRLLRQPHRMHPRRRTTSSTRTFSSTSFQSTAYLAPQEQLTADVEAIPRWRQTPKAMKMPFQVRRPARQDEFIVNEDPQRLHAVYNAILGKDGWRALTEDTRWLAVTHKSFDQGRRGFNARLSYIGKRIVELQYSLAMLSNTKSRPIEYEDDGRTPFEHPDLEGLEGLNSESKAVDLHHNRIAMVGEAYGLMGVIRWKPKITSDLPSSGLHMVTAQALYAIVGAVALERGGMDANAMVQGKILRPLGVIPRSSQRI